MSRISKLEYNQQLSILHKTIREERDNLIEVFRKRETFKRNYQELLQFLREQKFSSAAQQYFVIAKKHLQRRDYTTTSVLILLGAVCLIKSSQDLAQVHEFMEEKFLKSTFSIKILHLLLNARSDGFEEIFRDAWNIMKAIPMFEEEKSLIQHAIPF